MTEHKVLKTGLHSVTTKGVIKIYTELEYQQMNWWNKMKIKYNL
jgi:hypothetical protein